MTNDAGNSCIYSLVSARARDTPNATAIAAPGCTPLSYVSLQGQVEYAIKTLNAMGVGRHDRVALVLPNGPEMAVAFVAIAACATCAPVNPEYRANECERFLSALSPKAVILQSGMQSAVRTVAKVRGLPIIELAPVPQGTAGIFELTLGEDRPAKPSDHGFAGRDDVALLLPTSGTTSRPKLVPLTQSNLSTSANNIRQSLGLIESDRCLNTMPLFHIHGLIGAILSSLSSGASVVCTQGFRGSEFFKWMDDFKPTWYTAVPTMHRAILDGANTNPGVIARTPLRFIRSSSSALSPQLLRELERVFKVPVLEAYGMTEASHQVAINPLPPLQCKPRSVGLPTGTEILIADEAATPLPAGAVGEILIRGPSVTSGYHNDPTANQAAFTHGWLRTGDEGYQDADGYLFLTGRLKEMINRGGEKISPVEVDEILMEHSAISQASTFAIPHERLGEEIAAAVVLRENRFVTERELRDFLAARLADYKVPKQILVIDDIPKGPTGKPERMGLAQKLAPQLRARFTAPQNVLEVQLTRLWEEILRTEPIGTMDNFFGLGGTSLLAIQLFAEIDKRFGKSLPIGTLFQAPTIMDLARLLQRADASSTWSSSVAIQPEGVKPPFFLVHPVDGQVLRFRELGDYLGLAQPLYGLQSRRPDEPGLDSTIEEMAAHYTREMRAVQPKGPYLLGGYCLGGTIAFEMAQQLDAAGEQVGLLALFDATPPAALWRNFLRYTRRCPMLLVSRGKEWARALMVRFGGFLSTSSRDDGMLGSLALIERTNMRAKAAYVPKRYAGRIVCFWSDDLARIPEFELAWTKLADDGVDSQIVPGTQASIFKDPSVRFLAAKLQDRLNTAQSRNA